MRTDRTTTIIERAFQLARAGTCHSVADIRTRLAAEGYENIHSHLSGSAVQGQLKTALAARGVKAATLDADDDD